MTDILTEPPPSPTTWSPLRSPVFRAAWLATLASSFGGIIQGVGAAWMMTVLGSSAPMIAAVQAANTLPILLFSLWAGALADNADRRLIMLYSQIFMLLVSVALAMLALAGLLSPWTLLASTFLIGSGAAIHGAAWQASVGEMVPRSELTGAVILNSLGYNIARSAGPALGGAIVAAAGAAFAFFVNAITYVGLIMVLARWRPERAPRLMPREPLGVAIVTGINYVAMSPDLQPLLLRAALFGIGSAAVPSLLPLIARDRMAGGPLTYGLLLGAAGLGAVIGALGNAYANRRLSNEAILRLANLALALGTALIALTSIFPIVFVAMMLTGLGWMTGLSTFNVTMQMALPRWVVARGLALYRMCAFGGMALGSWIFGIATLHWGIGAALLAAAAVQAVAGLIGLRRPLPRVGRLNLDPLVRWIEPETAFRVDPRSGPIVVTIEYRIAEDAIGPFLGAMKERRRIRRRDGARHWILLRDLSDATLWIERYDVSTWLDYVRHNQRRTYADFENSEAIQALHDGPIPPRIERFIARSADPPDDTRTPNAGEIIYPAADPSQ